MPEGSVKEHHLLLKLALIANFKKKEARGTLYLEHMSWKESRLSSHQVYKHLFLPNYENRWDDRQLIIYHY